MIRLPEIRTAELSIYGNFAKCHRLLASFPGSRSRKGEESLVTLGGGGGGGGGGGQTVDFRRVIIHVITKDTPT